VQKSKVLLQEFEHFALLKRHLLGSCCQNVVLFRVVLIDLLFESISIYQISLLINKNRDILASTYTLMVVSYIVYKSYLKMLHSKQRKVKIKTVISRLKYLEKRKKENYFALFLVIAVVVVLFQHIKLFVSSSFPKHFRTLWYF
jgi:uncharacterized membrane protein